MKIKLSPKAVRQLKKLKRDKELRLLIADAIEKIAGDPYCGSKLEGQYAGLRKHKVGEWRILYEIYKKELVIVIIELVKRSEAYRGK